MYWHSWAKLLGDTEADMYATALDAPDAVQDRMAAAALAYMWNFNPRIGRDAERLIAVWFTGEGDAANPSLAEQDKALWNQQPPGSTNPANPTVRGYVDSVLAHIREITP